MFRLLFSSIVLMALVGCGNGVEPADGGVDSAVFDGAVPCPNNCNDGIACTEDRCVNSTCMHTPQNSRCPMNATCDAMRGCRSTRACTASSECEDNDSCTRNERCDPATRSCLFDVLDGDSDGIPPIACGGSDCNDDDGDVFPGAAERCNRIDDNCDGSIDEPAGMNCNCSRDSFVCPNGRGGFECVTLRDSPNCGACGVQCPRGASCPFVTEAQDSRCQCPSFAPNVCGAAGCVSLESDRAHCGVCGRACGSGEACQQGQCVSCASMGRVLCPDAVACVDVQTSRVHCGACGNVCPEGQVCQNGRCGSGCSGSQVMCPSAGCVDLQTNASHCGSCGNACPSGQACVGGACSCPTGQTRCGTTCVDAQSDANNCGGCGVLCNCCGSTTGTCAAGRCTYASCSSTPVMCDGVATCTFSDPRNCGVCGRACMPGRACARGSCL